MFVMLPQAAPPVPAAALAGQDAAAGGAGAGAGAGRQLEGRAWEAFPEAPESAELLVSQGKGWGARPQGPGSRLATDHLCSSLPTAAQACSAFGGDPTHALGKKALRLSPCLMLCPRCAPRSARVLPPCPSGQPRVGPVQELGRPGREQHAGRRPPPLWWPVRPVRPVRAAASQLSR